MKKTTPSGTRVFWIFKPAGTRESLDHLSDRIGQAWRSREVRLAIASILVGSRRNRSIAASLRPYPGAASMSLALAATIDSVASTSASAEDFQPAVLHGGIERGQVIRSAASGLGYLSAVECEV